MTLQEARDISARNHGYKDYAAAEYDLSMEPDLIEMKIINESTELYAKSQVNAALDKAIIMVENNGDYTVEDGKVYISEESVIEELKRLKR